MTLCIQMSNHMQLSTECIAFVSTELTVDNEDVQFLFENDTSFYIIIRWQMNDFAYQIKFAHTLIRPIPKLIGYNTTSHTYDVWMTFIRMCLVCMWWFARIIYLSVLPNSNANVSIRNSMAEKVIGIVVLVRMCIINTHIAHVYKFEHFCQRSSLSPKRCLCQVHRVSSIWILWREVPKKKKKTKTSAARAEIDVVFLFKSFTLHQT